MNANQTITFLEILLTRYLCFVLFNQPLMWYYKESYSNIDKAGFNGLMSRFLIAFIAWLLQYYSITYIPVGVF